MNDLRAWWRGGASCGDGSSTLGAVLAEDVAGGNLAQAGDGLLEGVEVVASGWRRVVGRCGFLLGPVPRGAEVLVGPVLGDRLDVGHAAVGVDDQPVLAGVVGGDHPDRPA